MTIREFIQLSILKPNKNLDDFTKSTEENQRNLFPTRITCIHSWLYSCWERYCEHEYEFRNRGETVPRAFDSKMGSYRRETIQDLFTVRMFSILYLTQVGSQRIMM